MAKAPTAPKDAPKDLLEDEIAEPSTDTAVATAPAPASAPGVPAPGVMQAGPGVIVPQLVASTFSMPDVINQHVSEAFPDAMPRPMANNPGVWMYPNGELFLPRQRRGGQFSFLLVDMSNAVTKRERRIALPIKERDNPDAFGLRGMEHVTARIEIICDFEDQMLAFLKEFGIPDAGDPLAQRMRAKGLSYDQAPTPGLMGPKG